MTGWHRATDIRCLAHALVFKLAGRLSHLADRIDPPLRHIDGHPGYRIEIRAGRKYIYDAKYGTFLASIAVKE